MGNSRKRIFITGIAGFIGFHLAKHLQKRGDFVIGCDNFNDYYDPSLKKQRVDHLSDILVIPYDISSPHGLVHFLKEHKITHLVHLAAQAGVRYSLQQPEKYLEANMVGFFQVLEALRQLPHIKFTYASSSSVYGHNKKIPFSEQDPTDHPANFYGATKKSNEVMAFAYHQLYSIATTGLRFFSVYGPFGRPDMAYYSFTKAILEGTPISLFNQGNMQRDFTYIEDIVAGTAAAIDLEAPYEIFNLGNNKSEPLGKLVTLIETFTGKKALVKKLPPQPGEIETTYADITKAQTLLGFSPQTSLEEGMEQFLKWYTLDRLVPVGN